MSRAFVKEDIDPPERSRRARSASGLPPGAANYMTTRGAKLLRDKLPSLAGTQREELEALLASATIVDAPGDDSHIAFGAKVTIRRPNGELQSYQIVGVDELDLYSDAISWISELGKALLAAEIRDKVILASGERVEVVRVEYPR